MLKVASSERYFQLYEAIRKGVSLEKLSEITHIAADVVPDRVAYLLFLI